MGNDDMPVSPTPVHEVYNASGKVAENLIELFRNCLRAMQTNDLKSWWIYLDMAYMEGAFAIKEKEKDNLEILWKKIDPTKKEAYGPLKEYHLELRDKLKKFFTMGESQTGPATWRR